MAIDLNTLASHLRNFMSQRGFPVRDFTTGVGLHPSRLVNEALGTSNPGDVLLSPGLGPGLQSLQNRYGKQRGRLNDKELSALQVLSHEILHQMRYGRSPDVYNTPQGQEFEEAATEATTQDILPIITAKLFGHKMPSAKPPAGNKREVFYPGEVKNLRQLSVFGSGAKQFTDYNARVWRRNFLHADAPTRNQMANSAMQARIAWGQTSGRDVPIGSKPDVPPGTPKPRPPRRRLPRNGMVDY